MDNYVEIYSNTISRSGAEKLLEFITKNEQLEKSDLQLAVLIFERMCGMYNQEKNQNKYEISNKEIEKIAIIGLIGSVLKIEEITNFISLSKEEKFAICNFMQLQTEKNLIFLKDEDYVTRLLTIIANSAFLQAKYL